MNTIQRLKNKKGFTLVELIVVIVIIAILAAVSVPMLTKYVKNAKESAKLAAIDVVSTAAQTAAASVLGGLSTTKNFMLELDELLPDKYTVDLADLSTANVRVFLGKDKEKNLIRIYGSGLHGANPVITSIEADKWNWKD